MLREEGRAISNANESERPEPYAAQLDAVFLSLWRRALEEGSGLELTLTEAAALLGTTTQTLRRRIQRDEIQTRRDSRGRLRVIPLLGVSNEMVEDPSDAQITVARLFDELKRVRQDLAQAVARQDVLMQELITAREALVWAQDELSAQSQRGLQKWSLGERADIDGMKRQRLQLASKLDAARKLAGRRSWHDMPAMGGRAD